MFIWSYAGDRIAISIRSPLGEVVERIQPTSNYYQEIQLTLGNTRLLVQYFIPAFRGTDQLSSVILENPTPGVWTITVHADSIITGVVHAWLPLTGFVDKDTVFLTPEPSYTVTVPSCARNIASIGGYDNKNGSLYVASGRGPTRLNILKPQISAPAVNVAGMNQKGYSTITGTSAATAITTGAAALILEWGIVRGNQSSMNTLSILSYLINGTNKREGEIYPNNSWGYGTLNLYRAFQNIR